MRFALVAALALAACGRFGFGDDQMPRDAPSDASDALDAFEPCPPTAHVCDDFEAANMAKWNGMYVSQNATTAINGVRPHAGGFGLEANVPPAAITGGYAILYKKIPNQTSGVIATRQWVYALAPFNLFDEVVALRLSTATDEYVVFGCDNLSNWAATERSAGAGLVDHLSTTPCVTGAWVCVETVYSLSARHATFYVDGTAVLDVNVADPAPQFDQVEVGATRADSAGFHVFVDDVVIADRRLSCQ